MKKIYINLFSFILLVLLAGISNDAKAQKNLKLRITRIEAANTAVLIAMQIVLILLIIK
jgi:hypothetical protein